MISVIIPTYNESEIIARTMDIVQANSVGWVTEFIVVDGGSTDDTVDIVKKYGVDIYVSNNPGRAHQMNEGAKMAKGEILYFLHADTFPPVGFDQMILDARRHGYHAGAFRLRFNKSKPLLNFYSWFSRFNWKICRGGDRSLFVNKELFENLDGFPETPIMEDYEFSSKLSKLVEFVVLPKEVITSARKYEKYGLLKLQLVFGWIQLLHTIGVSKERLYNIYKRSLKA